ncbi:olfactory receptor 5AR1-like [Pelodytes ibericus]
MATRKTTEAKNACTKGKKDLKQDRSVSGYFHSTTSPLVSKEVLPRPIRDLSPSRDIRDPMLEKCNGGVTVESLNNSLQNMLEEIKKVISTNSAEIKMEIKEEIIALANTIHVLEEHQINTDFQVRNLQDENKSLKIKLLYLEDKISDLEDRSLPDCTHITCTSTQLALTYLTEFTLLGLSRSKEVHFQILLTFTIIYIVTLLGNCLLIILIIADRDLLTPMYYFLCHLSFLDICCVSVTVPKMLTDLWTHKNIISYVGCFTQLYFFHFLGSSECFLLGIMSYDHYIAICHPLRYCQIINMRICLRLAAACWVSGIFFSFSHTFLVVSLSFCTSNVINHFFCDIPPLLQLSSTDTTKNILEIFILGGTVVGGCFSLTFISYILIILSILKIKSVEGKQKAFSTCASHLIIVSIFFGTILFMYLRPPSAYSLENDKLLSVFYNICTPMLNPVIYSFRNKEVKKALNRMLHKIGLIEAAVTSRFEKQITRPNVLSLDPSTSYQVASIKKGTSPTPKKVNEKARRNSSVSNALMQTSVRIMKICDRSVPDTRDWQTKELPCDIPKPRDFEPESKARKL